MKKVFYLGAVLIAAALTQCGGGSNGTTAQQPQLPALSGENKMMADAVNKAVQDAVSSALAALPSMSITSSRKDALAANMVSEDIDYYNGAKTIHIHGTSESITADFTGHSVTTAGSDNTTHTLVTSGTMSITYSEAEAKRTKKGDGSFNLTFDGAAHTMRQTYAKVEDHRAGTYSKTGTVAFDGIEFSAEDSGKIPVMPELKGINLGIAGELSKVFMNQINNVFSTLTSYGPVKYNPDGTLLIEGNAQEKKIDLILTLNGFRAPVLYGESEETAKQMAASITATAVFSQTRTSDTIENISLSMKIGSCAYSDPATGDSVKTYQNITLLMTQSIDKTAGTKMTTITAVIDGVTYAAHTEIVGM